MHDAVVVLGRKLLGVRRLAETEQFQRTAQHLLIEGEGLAGLAVESEISGNLHGVVLVLVSDSRSSGVVLACA